jgi:Lrp/AsnC family transcriptional regulator, leucine-responsive regulatory protein
MDDLDRKILDIVQRNNQLTAGTIARRVGLSPSAVQRRLKRLRDSKVIEHDVSTVSPEAIGRGFIVIASIILESESTQIRRQFGKIVEAMPEVMQCYYVTGETTDFFLVVTARDKNDYNSFMARLTDQFPKIKRFSTNVVLDRVKTGLSVPIFE